MQWHEMVGNEKMLPTLPGYVLRGGSWRLNPDYCRAAVRSFNSRDSRYSDYGFRVCVAPRT